MRLKFPLKFQSIPEKRGLESKAKASNLRAGDSP